VPLTETYTLITSTDDGVRLWLDGRLASIMDCLGNTDDARRSGRSGIT
jgi:hypothetical protein